MEEGIEMKFILIITTTDNEETAKNIAKKLVEDKLAACVQILENMKSFYFWKNQVVEDKEYLILIKSKDSLYKKIENKILEMHNYELPEIIVLPIEKGYKKYLDWLEGNTLEVN